jgi:RimJ/RimL family protein N-acetyltransferase
MKIEKYGVTLKRLTEDKIELIRNWRNDPKISKYMEYREYITPEMQQKWFQRVNNNLNFYYIIEYNKKEIGLINVRDINFEKKEGEAGIFIFDDESLQTDISFRSILCLYDYCFFEIKLEKLVAHILKDNKVSVVFNKLIGYRKEANQEDVNLQLYCLTFENYFEYRDKIIKSLKSI